jgi:hypothetical protein
MAMGHRRPDRQTRQLCRLLLESLEGRCVPSTVTNLNDSGDGSLRQAILDTPAGGKVHFQPGLTGRITLTSGELAIGRDLTIDGPGASVITVSGNHASRIFDIIANPTVAISGLTIGDGFETESGGGIQNFGTLVLTNSTLTDNSASLSSGVSGGAIDSLGTLTVSGCTFTGNSAIGSSGLTGGAGFGGGIASVGALSVTGCTLSDNVASGPILSPGGGGGIDSSGTLTLTYSFLQGNSANLGGGVYATGGMVNVTDTIFDSNSALNGGGINNTHAMLTVRDSILTGNTTSQFGGGIFNDGTLTLLGTTLHGNGGRSGSSILGGGINNAGTLIATRSTLSDNFASGGGAGAGGGIFSNDTATLTDCTLIDNSANFVDAGSGIGGGIDNAGGMLSLTACALIGNTAASFGGGIDNPHAANDHLVTVIDCIFSGNSARGAFNAAAGGIYNGGLLALTDTTLDGNFANQNGGGIDNDGGTVTVTGCTLSGNSANTFAGGGIYNQGTLTLTDSTLSGNSMTGGAGGGIYNVRALTLTGCTVSGNSAAGGGGIANAGSGTIGIRNTILAGNQASTSRDVSGSLNSQGYNLIGDGTGGSGFVGTDLVGAADMPIDPMLGPLQDNGGPTFTTVLASGSPALDAGDPAELGTADQRGVFRSGGVNIGAYQASASRLVLTAPDTVASGVPFDLSVAAVDPFGQAAVGYTGTVTFSSSDNDPAVVLPPHYTFTLADAGTVVFLGGVTLITEGDQTITATDTSDGTITGTATVTVTSGNAPRLAWTVARGPATPGAVPAQPSNRQAARETSEGQAARSEAASVPVTLATAQHAADSVFAGWDIVPDGLALNWSYRFSEEGGRTQTPSTCSR